MPNSLDQNGVGFPAGKPSKFNYPRTGDFQTSTPQTDMYPRGANHLWKQFNPSSFGTNGLNFFNLEVSGTWIEVNLFGFGYDGFISYYPLFVKTNSPSNAIGDGFYGLYCLGASSGTLTNYSKPVSFRGIPFNKLYFSYLYNVTVVNDFYLHLSWGTDTDENKVQIQ